MSIPLTPQYDPKSLYTDGCSSAGCSAALSAPSSLTQGRMFADMTRTLHGGRRRRGRRSHTRRLQQRGGAADFPSAFSSSALLPSNMHSAADIGALDTAFSQLPQFVGKYGGSGGSRKAHGRRGRKTRGGGFGYTPGPAVASNYMILSPSEEPKAFLNPQWYTENQVVPSFQGPTNAFAQQSYNNQFNYAQRAGRRMNRKGSRKSCRKTSRKASRKNSRKNRKANRRS